MSRQQCTVPGTTSATDVKPSVCLVTPLTVVAQAVGVALRSRGVEVHEDARRRRTASRDSTEVAVVLDDLATAADVRRVLAQVGSTSGPMLVLTARERGPYWGALVAAGATSIMSSAASVDEVVGAIRTVNEGNQLQTPDEQSELLTQWDTFLRQQRDTVARLAKLTMRERVVLEGMAEGISVPQQAVVLDVAETTVRSHVKSILRKLGVRSQLAAVAVVHQLDSPLVAGAALMGEPGGEVRRSGATSLGT